MIHSTAMIDTKAQIGADVRIGPWCVIGPDVTIGDGTTLMSHVVIEGETTIGKRNRIFPFTVLGGAPQDLKYKGEKTRLEIGDNNTIRENVTVNLGTEQGGGLTRIGNDNLLMAYVHLGHDCLVGNNCILANHVGLAGHVEINDFANLGGMVGVSQYVRIGSYTYIAGYSGLEKDVPPFSIAIGLRPSVLKGANIVGLRRRGYPAEIISKINETIKLWIRPDVTKEQSLLEIESQYGEFEEIRDFLSFINDSRCGVTR